jgi:hypothetical protein
MGDFDSKPSSVATATVGQQISMYCCQVPILMGHSENHKMFSILKNDNYLLLIINKYFINIHHCYKQLNIGLIALCTLLQLSKN